MRLLSLEVQNYRNICAARLEPGRELTVICGNNGQGKTNLLEAIWLLTGGKSFRGGKDAELVRRGETFAVLDAVTLRAWQEDQERDDPSHVRITVGTPDSQRPGRYASVNGTLIKATISGLKAGTTYYVKCRATGAGGTTTSETSRVITAY